MALTSWSSASQPGSLEHLGAQPCEVFSAELRARLELQEVFEFISRYGLTVIDGHPLPPWLFTAAFVA